MRPLLFAGVLIEGAVISYETNLTSGGAGARMVRHQVPLLCIEKIVLLSLRMVSVATGEILIEVLTEKTIFSHTVNQKIYLDL